MSCFGRRPWLGDQGGVIQVPARAPRPRCSGVEGADAGGAARARVRESISMLVTEVGADRAITRIPPLQTVQFGCGLRPSASLLPCLVPVYCLLCVQYRVYRVYSDVVVVRR